MRFLQTISVFSPVGADREKWIPVTITHGLQTYRRFNENIAHQEMRKMGIAKKSIMLILQGKHPMSILHTVEGIEVSNKTEKITKNEGGFVKRNKEVVLAE